jgi:hypothetical protein
MVNITLAKGHHDQTRRTGRKCFNFPHVSSICSNENGTLLFLTREFDIARFDSQQYSNDTEMELSEHGITTKLQELKCSITAENNRSLGARIL